MIRKLVLLAITSGLIKKAWEHYRDRQETAPLGGTVPASPTPAATPQG
jgi:hypothetical protein